MMTLLVLLFVCLVIPLLYIAVWFVRKNRETDEWYEKELDKIYSRKRR